MHALNRRSALGIIAAAPVWGGGAWAAANPPAASNADAGLKLATAAREQVGVTLDYDASYRKIGYPNGDVLRTSGVCSDVLVRAARDAWEVDLQQRVHQDMVKAFDAYPSRREWGLSAPDANIDHRRVLNIETYLTRQHAKLSAPRPGPLGGDAFDAPQAGDVLTWRVLGGRPHLGVVVNGPKHVTVVHNIGLGAKEEPLWMFKLYAAAGHYRWRA